MGRTRILLVDDDIDFLEIVGTMLEADFDVEKASTAAKAFDRIEASPPDLVVLDVMLARPFEGFEILRRLRDDPRTGRTPVVLLTGMEDRQTTRTLEDEAQRGPCGYLQKPPDPIELRSAIDRLLAATRVP
jgi:CheY-like chemotaxis protein